MPPAARLSDLSNHGGSVLGPGVPTVMIGGLPAAVVGDMHACPMVNAGHPPVSAFVLGSATVLIGGKPALRVGDSCVCGGAPAVGSPTVLIGG
ncbi:MAG: hypothetical protein RI907_1160 [Pseudomonadota bacterium]|jgi:uncharacterized Zn-binding protein involved in type VI secretion